MIFAAGTVFGILFWGGFHTVVEVTNTMGFCTSCHEMDQVFEEYQQSVHYKNAAGVRAICSDCHVPRPWWPKMVRKAQATNELYHTLVGSIDTPQKFEEKRLNWPKGYGPRCSPPIHASAAIATLTSLWISTNRNGARQRR